ncbi:MAG: potassium transporter Trk [Candidatus Cloacimonetes bacterium]|nr:potassium transporter Trk [Candidatus Cloacimonadota bacterium]
MSSRSLREWMRGLHQALLNWTRILEWAMHLFALAHIVLLLMSYHWSADPAYQSAQWILTRSLLWMFVFYMVVRTASVAPNPRSLRNLVIDYLALGLALISGVQALRFFRLFIIGRQTLLFVRSAASRHYHALVFGRLSRNPPGFVLLTFAITIVVGTFLLSLPWARAEGAHSGAPLLDAFFTATSATCVTGLIVQDTGAYWSSYGQLVILLLIQIGGLGIMTISTALAILLGQRLTSRSENLLSTVVGEAHRLDIISLVKNIFFVTISFEALGAVFYWAGFVSSANPPPDPVYYAIFHSVSAFCNAGFSLFSDSFVSYRSSLGVNLTTVGLVIVGGIGFSVLVDLRRNVLERRRPGLLSLHTKLVLGTTLVLLLAGFIIFFISEYNVTMRGMNLGERSLAAMFQSVTTRTAGFNTIDNGEMSDTSALATLLLMFIGASPGSTGGGVKTTTFAVIMLSVVAIIRSGEGVSVFRRRISDEMLKRVLALIAASIGFLFLMVSVLFLVEKSAGIPLQEVAVVEVAKKTAPPVVSAEPQVTEVSKDFRSLVFEAMSAFGTVGLSLGVTGHLTSAGKFVIIILMFIGRVGPLTFIYALSETKNKKTLAYTEEKITVG